MRASTKPVDTNPQITEAEEGGKLEGQHSLTSGLQDAWELRALRDTSPAPGANQHSPTQNTGKLSWPSLHPETHRLNHFQQENLPFGVLKHVEKKPLLQHFGLWLIILAQIKLVAWGWPPSMDDK